mmetsp:Transcript_113274/g.283733  ORF Transcript_113274/g.283733 Transcript_113274/m.283733 type:complete len:627 (-) Transcript_113274:83-1963(-)
MPEGRRSTVAALAQSASPLLKFKEGKAVLHEQGLDLIRSIPGRIYPVILMGDGRAGKSYLASRILGLEEAFVSSDSAEPVTEGIDAIVCPMSKLLAETPGVEPNTATAPQGEGDELEIEEPMHMLILDCEGGNNAMADIRTLVNVFGSVIGTEVIFVCNASFSESALQSLSATLAARELIILDEGSKLPEQKLIFVVNKNMLKYDENTLENTLRSEQKDPGRRDARQVVLTSFSQRRFISIDVMGKPNFENQVDALRAGVIQDRRPLTMGGHCVGAGALCALLEHIVNEMQSMNEVTFTSMKRKVILDGFLTPLVARLFSDAENSIPEVEDYDPNLDDRDCRAATLQKFDTLAARVSEVALLSEARADLQEKLDSVWFKVQRLNAAFGAQTKETKTEHKEILGAARRVPVGGRGLLKDVELLHQAFRTEVRTVIINKNGSEEKSDWEDAGTRGQKIIETAFQSLSSAVPALRGTLLKRSPSIVKTVMTLGVGEFQTRRCIVKEGHFIWWDTQRVKKESDAVSGSINFLINRAVVVEDEENPNLFSIKPALHSGWDDASCFSGGTNRELTFSCEGSERNREQWVNAIRRNIAFADLAFEQLGRGRVKREVGVEVPLLAQALWTPSTV